MSDSPEECVVESYRAVAPKTLVAQMDSVGKPKLSTRLLMAPPPPWKLSVFPLLKTRGREPRFSAPLNQRDARAPSVGSPQSPQCSMDGNTARA